MNMKINKIDKNYNIYTNNNIQTKPIKSASYISNPTILTNGLNNLALINKVMFTGQNYDIGLNRDELIKRTMPNGLLTITLLKTDSPEYTNLADGDKQALKHLIKAADAIAEVELQLDDENNIPFKKYLEKEIAKGNLDAELAMELFNGQKGIFAKDLLFNEISLAKRLKQSPGRGVYPRDLSVEEFHSILFKMLDEDMDKEVKNLLNQRTVVVRDGDYLKGVDYIDKCKKEFSIAADELEKAADVSTDEDFNKYLVLQAQALRTANPMLDAYADKKWASLQDTPLEFTITRENYEDKMTETIFRNKELLKALEEHGITPIAKDFLGGRVGIVNKEGTEFLKESKALMPKLAELMPFKDEYKQEISAEKQSMVDVDIVDVTGAVGEYRGKITLAENLPNSDKLSLTIGGGKRNVYHKSLRKDKFKALQIYNKVLDKSQIKYITPDSNHYFTVGHENAHSLGPHHNDAKLGEYRNILEENKADVAAISFVDELTKMGVYTKAERKGILINFVMSNFLKVKPDMSIAHRVRQVMQCKYLGENGAYEIKNGKVHVNTDKVVPACKKMLKEVTRIQIDGDYDAAAEYVNKNFVWTDDMELIAGKLNSEISAYNGTLNTPLADYLRNSK